LLGGWTFRYWDENSGDSVLNYFTPSGIESPLFYSLHVSLTHFKLSVQCLVKSKGAAMRMTGMIVMVFGFGLMVLGYQFSLSAESQITHAVTGYLSI
ncbi:hypothetical protein KKA17_02095, partial [bacterium]|nr:hypothetical protein [bacterium]MBU1884787.1 hypothetical protein [bacterium]